MKMLILLKSNLTNNQYTLTESDLLAYNGNKFIGE